MSEEKLLIGGEGERPDDFAIALLPAWVKNGAGALRIKRKFLKQFKLIWVVQPFVQKYFSFAFPEIGVLSFASRLDRRGAYRDRHDTRGGMRWTRMCRETSGTIADGEVVWSWRAHAGAKLATMLNTSCWRRWQTSWFTGESSK